ncbi:protein NEGATIVE REGULATOR OF RESISTANCE-like [Phoenix dactylifera]|uniref:Protein NEGATIVE REGULATOR OF RESISTANCE-like n=1 Tax=Phoenix dactylifera TaxID=42345 RepID=A0A8B8JB87_PHODC|nr:protein NEGATIVE REGULATOR OF RESISTANCE-like [Phoenix dactylifera]
MESRKRKRAADGLEDGSPTRSRCGEDDGREVTDGEVEEFFAIIRRMNDLSRCLAFAGVGGETGCLRPAADGRRVARQWSPTFVWEDFAGTAAGKDDCWKGRSTAVAAEGEERVADNGTPRFFDLNAEPEPEPEGLVVACPRGESTASRRAPAPA